MSTSYLQYSKFILLKVSFDVKLFEKELRKCLRLLLTQEIRELKRWCRATFPKNFRRMMTRCFRLFRRNKAAKPQSAALAAPAASEPGR
ncbi:MULTISPECIES: hypothetical protein [Rufibacter]|uniref:Uncharacterized protein n=1 Tax=Rufibacter quisquiliarum TaxID=1549639 RepID=A0A839GIX3_9BACT|nr:MULTISPECIES: hypothetical protein [Rufibacter]MBA9075555.1 hypothetical protein [Rufibacter quisquiliarum]